MSYIRDAPLTEIRSVHVMSYIQPAAVTIVCALLVAISYRFKVAT